MDEELPEKLEDFKKRMRRRLGCNCYNKEGKPISLMEYADLFEDPSYQVIKKDFIGPYEISTVWLGINHNIRGEPKKIFETMVFTENEEDEFYRYQERYATLQEAELGHEIIAKIIEAKVNARNIE
ncbi:MAG TPA: hypothetical protein VIJ14_01810 [Rhabdochlamydiaceae bacterium]